HARRRPDHRVQFGAGEQRRADLVGQLLPALPLRRRGAGRRAVHGWPLLRGRHRVRDLEALMYTPSENLAALMVSTQRRPHWVDLYTIKLHTGLVLRWHDSDREVVSFDGTEWRLGPGIERSKLEWGLSLDVQECEIELYPRRDG